MIGRLRGILGAKKPPFLLIDVGGVGYECQTSMSTFYQLPELEQPVSLFTHLVVREDAQLLYGFYDEKERALFKALIKISGVGPKVALSLLSGMDAATFLQCIERRDIAYLIKLPGVGKKTAERLLVEMSGKCLTEEYSTYKNIAESTYLGATDANEEAISALIALGYKPHEASKMISTLAKEEGHENLSSQVLIRKALQGLGRV